ncbi:hypothetical protein M011DRAFT_474045 [Sporormia fimetaria CBS 119925]|uniref:COX assembly mitochondrial protein n=1 Tax=Sporormia fimetaria CBS 119925 TaxID=1340428 RepID=A0A6A6VPA1_9PLEO|nr:hypothetical protein M011DRAFT_474045 [Sporormia fimetaria CBS 119925]
MAMPPPTPEPLPRDDRDTGVKGLKVPLNPTPLSAPQEQQVREIYYSNVRSYCVEELKAFAECTQNRTFSMAWACRDAKMAMNACMLKYQGPDEMDKAREQWFRLAGERKKAKEEKERKAAEAMKKHREYWGAEEIERKIREMEKRRGGK